MAWSLFVGFFESKQPRSQPLNTPAAVPTPPPRRSSLSRDLCNAGKAATDCAGTTVVEFLGDTLKDTYKYEDALLVHVMVPRNIDMQKYKLEGVSAVIVDLTRNYTQELYQFFVDAREEAGEGGDGDGSIFTKMKGTGLL